MSQIRKESGVAAALKALTFGGPVHEALHVIAVFPGKPKELAGGQIGGFSSKKGLKTPTYVRTGPGFKPIAASRIPVVQQRLEHILAQWAKCPALDFKTLLNQELEPRDGRAQ